MNTAEYFIGSLLRLDFGEPAAPSAREFDRRVPFYRRNFLARGLMGTLLGGFYFDYRLSLWLNTLHFYLFLALLFVPFTCYMIFGSNNYIGFGLYIIFTAFIIPIKVFNHWLHKHLDPVEKPPPKQPKEAAAPPNDIVVVSIDNPAVRGSLSSDESQALPGQPSAATQNTPVEMDRIDIINTTQKKDVGAGVEQGSSSSARPPSPTVIKAMEEFEDVDLSDFDKDHVVPHHHEEPASDALFDAEHMDEQLAGDTVSSSTLPFRMAAGLDDTEHGVVHSYIDENGQVQHYVFYDPSVQIGNLSAPLGNAEGYVDEQAVSNLVAEIMSRNEQQGSSSSSPVNKSKAPAESDSVEAPKKRRAKVNRNGEGSSSSKSRSSNGKSQRERNNSEGRPRSKKMRPRSASIHKHPEATSPASSVGESVGSSAPRESESSVASSKGNMAPVMTTSTVPDPAPVVIDIALDAKEAALDAAMQETPETKPIPLSSSSNDQKEKIRSKRWEAIQERLGRWRALVTFRIRLMFPKEISRKLLEDLFDRTLSGKDVAASSLLSMAVTTLAYQIYQLYDFTVPIFFLSLVIASAQYSLLKSPQPDTASPLHVNRLSGFSRAVYVTLLSAIILILNATAKMPSAQTVMSFYGIVFQWSVVLSTTVDILLIVILALPAMHLFSLLPQINTLFNYLIEQWLMHVMGSTATQSLLGAIVELVKSILVLAPSFFAVAGVYLQLSSGINSSLIFALGCGLLMGAAYFSAAIEFIQPEQWTLIFGRIEKLFQREAKVSLWAALLAETGKPSLAWLFYDVIATFAIIALVFLLHISTVFNYNVTFIVFVSVALGFAFTTQFILPQLRRPYPFSVLAQPILKAAEHGRYEPSSAAKVMWFEDFSLILLRFQRYLLFPTVTICLMSLSADYLRNRFGPWLGAFVTIMAAGKLARISFGDLATYPMALFFGVLFFKEDLSAVSESLLLDIFLVSIVVPKIKEAFLKASFHLVYISPWNLSWGSAFHAAMQPLSFPHSALMLFQMLVSSALSAPYYPLGGSTAFLLSYVRPVRFWERKYKTNRLQDTDVRLADTFERSAATTINNLNSVFYEHLSKTLSLTLYDDIQRGRYGGDIENGDMFIMTSDKLTGVLHIIQLGHGFVTFQLRGLEFKGTYCQERELESINEDSLQNNKNVLWLKSWHKSRNLLSLNASFVLRWRTWEVLNQTTVFRTYSISLIPATNMFFAYSLRMAIIKYFVMSTIYFLLESPQLESWLSSPTLLESLMALSSSYSARDSDFSNQIDPDYDDKRMGISIHSFQRFFGEWIKVCVRHRKRRSRKAMKTNMAATAAAAASASAASPSSNADNADSKTSIEKDEELDGKDKEKEKTVYFLSSSDPKTSFYAPRLLRLCYGMSLVARRALHSAIMQQPYASPLETFLHGYHQLFKGDVRVTSSKDEWVFNDISLLDVVKRAVRLSLKLHQDHVSLPDEYDNLETLYDAMQDYLQTLVICHEGEAEWANAIMADKPSLLSMRKNVDDKSDNAEQFVLMLNMKYSKFRTIKLNREAVRGMWAAQQLEQIFFGNENEERGSIQQMRSAVRNLITQSCDLPVGYPIFISALTTSHSTLPSLLDFNWWFTEMKKWSTLRFGYPAPTQQQAATRR